ncbi:interleukin-13 receptor subunit alpha-1-like [Cetorhinus maximus]
MMLRAPSFLIMAILWTVAMNGASLTSSQDLCNHMSSITNLSCLFYNYSQMNCTWDLNEHAPADAQYALSYQFIGKNEELTCQMTGCCNTTCQFQKDKLNHFDIIEICVAESSQHLTKPCCISISPATYYKASAPIKVEVNETEVKWDPPRGVHPSEDFFYQVQITDNSNNVKKIEDVTLTKWIIENRKKRYSVKVRAKIDNHFSDSLWSDWSQAVNIEPQPKDYTLLTEIAVVIIVVALVVLLMFTCRRYKLLENLCQPVPDPERMFKGLYDHHNGDFQEWINAKPLVTKVPDECIAVTLED